MAVKGDRQINATEIRYISEAAMEAGICVVVKSSQPTGRGVSPGYNDAAPVAVKVSGTPASGTRPIGMLLDNVVSIDPTKQHRNYQRVESLIGEPMCVLTDGWCRTNMITGTPAAGDPAYLGVDSTFDTTQRNSIPAVGKFVTAKGTDGFAIVSVKLP